MRWALAVLALALLGALLLPLRSTPVNPVCRDCGAAADDDEASRWYRRRLDPGHGHRWVSYKRQIRSLAGLPLGTDLRCVCGAGPLACHRRASLSAILLKLEAVDADVPFYRLLHDPREGPVYYRAALGFPKDPTPDAMRAWWKDVEAWRADGFPGDFPTRAGN